MKMFTLNNGSKSPVYNVHSFKSDTIVKQTSIKFPWPEHLWFILFTMAHFH